MERVTLRWRLSQQETVQVFLRTIKLLSTVDQIIFILVRPDRLDLFSEHDTNSTALICTFKNSYFNDFACQNFKTIAVHARHLLSVTDPHKNSIVSLFFAMRRDDFLDIKIDYNTGLSSAHGVPLSDAIHQICHSGGPECALYRGWVADKARFWDEKLVKLFPGQMNYLALKISSQGIQFWNFDHERTQIQTHDKPIFVSRDRIQSFLPLQEIQITSIPWRRLKYFLESVKKCRFKVKVTPEFSQAYAQCLFQAANQIQTAYYTLILGADIPSVKVKPEFVEDKGIEEFRQLL